MAVKIFSRMDDEAYKRLSDIKNKYGFKSEYEIIQYVVGCFLRVADPENDTNQESIPKEIADMFNDLSDEERQFDFVKPKRARTYNKQKDALNS
ncbi:hypothetical protein [uncultured Bacteroides sp.]|uniref:hypothetical protein n=1 Tax=uncultured Bacteroides sp. TaxID=162156 RepID=UPI002AAAE5B6|nr:hypothetical protein [uncultured Bacteroides sp.]